MKQVMQRVTQIVFLALFAVLIAAGKAQLWMGLFVLAIFAAFLFGRVYCGWFCPIHTITSGVTWVKKKLHLKNLKTPALLTKPYVRYAALGIFIAIFVFTMISGKKLPVLPALLVIGAALTLFFPEEVWHRYLCPYGTILSLPASKAKNRMTIDPSLCSNCGACERVCPAKAVDKSGDSREIKSSECLVCMKCSAVCKMNAIKYQGTVAPSCKDTSL